jgi:hypothetical protein
VSGRRLVLIPDTLPLAGIRLGAFFNNPLQQAISQCKQFCEKT